MWNKLTVCLLMGLLSGCIVSYGQQVDSVASKLINFPTKLFSRVQSKAADLDKQLTKQTEKYIRQMAKREARLQKKIAKVDSAAAKRLFAGSAESYAALLRKFKNDTAGGKLGSEPYQPYTDSLRTSLNFLQQNPQLLNAAGKDATALQAQLQGSAGQLQQLQAKMQGTDAVNTFIQQRKDQLKAYLSQYTQLPPGLNNAYQGLNQRMYYYTQQLTHYKEMLNNPDELEKKALAVLDQTAAFQNFMKNNSQLASLFGLPGTAGNGANATTAQALAGLQTRDQLQQMVQGQLSGGGGNAMQALQQNLESGQSQLDALKNKISQYGQGGQNIESTDFTPNDQKTKTLWKRLEYGVNMQTTRTNYAFPLVTDFGLSLGYKLSNNNTVGVGGSYKMGWGSGINHIAISSQGAGLRSFLNIHIKGSWSATGGLEYNYETPFVSLQQINHLSYWTQSGLIGIMKTVSLKSPVLKKTTLQLLWDFLSYQQVPRTQPILFRIGYGL
jgi:hypothetical protein